MVPTEVEPGSIDEVTARLESWCRRNSRGLARVDFDQVSAMQEVIGHLRKRVARQWTDVPLLVTDQPPASVIGDLESRLDSCGEGIASITGLEWAFPEDNRTENLASLNFSRENFAERPLLQIWWLPSHLAGQFILGAPDLDSWFQLRLHLTEVLVGLEIGRNLELLGASALSVEAAVAIAQRYWERVAPAKLQGIPSERIWTELAFPAAEGLTRAGLETEASRVLQDAIAMGLGSCVLNSLKDLGPDYPTQDRMAVLLAQSLRQVGDLKSDSESQSLASEVERWTSTNPQAIVSARGDVGLNIGVAGSLDVRKAQEDLVSASRRELGDYARDTLLAKHKLALTRAMQGDFAGARQLQESVLATLLAQVGEEHADTLAGMNNLAETLYLQGDLQGAQRLQDKVLKASRHLLGADHASTLTAKNNLAMTLSSRGEYDAARTLNQEVLSARRRLLGESHPDTLTSMNNLALSLLHEGELDEAQRLLEAVVGADPNATNSHLNTLTAMNNLAVAYKEHGSLREARSLQERVLILRRKALGETHPHTLITMNNLAQILKESGDLEAARQMQGEVVTATVRGLGEEHPQSLTAKNNLAGIFKAQGNLQEAYDLEELVVKVSERVLGQNHPETSIARKNLTDILSAMGGLVKTSDSGNGACSIQTNSNGPDA